MLASRIPFGKDIKLLTEDMAAPRLLFDSSGPDADDPLVDIVAAVLSSRTGPLSTGQASIWDMYPSWP